MMLLLGSTGQVGRQLKQRLSAEQGLLCPERQELDLSDLASVRAYLIEKQPTVIINASAYTQVDLAESEVNLANQLNHLLPELLAQYSNESGAFLVHYSSDYVYEGIGQSPQTEGSNENPCNQYGVSKLAGDNAIRANTRNYCILRTSWVYSDHGHNFMNTMLKLASNRSELKVVNDQIGAPTSARWIAEVSDQVIQKKITGLYNLACDGYTSWFQFATEIFKQAKQRKILTEIPTVKPIDTLAYPTPAKRPCNSRLDCTALKHKLDMGEFPTWQKELKQVFNDRLQHGQNND